MICYCGLGGAEMEVVDDMLWWDGWGRDGGGG